MIAGIGRRIGCAVGSVVLRRRGGNYSILRSPTSLNLASGESGDVLVTLTLRRGEAQMATLTVPDLPDGWTAEFSDNPISTDGGTSTMTLTAP